MLVPGKDGERPYQRFRDRVTFPIRDRRGRIIAFGGRVLGDAKPKYLNSPETLLFHKGRELYGLYEARRAARESGTVIVVEGYMDVVALAHHGVENAVATLGTAANTHHSEILFRTVPNLVFCFDGDGAGRAAAARALLATLPLLEDGRDAHFLFLPDGEDPDSVVRERGEAGFRELLAAKVPIVDFLYQHLAEDIDVSGIGGKAQLAERAKPLLGTIPRGVYRQLAVRRLETLVGLPLGEERSAAAKPPPSARPQGRDAGGLTPMSRAVLLVLQFPALVARVPSADIDPERGAPGADALIALIDLCVQEPTISTAALLERSRNWSTHDTLTRLAVRAYWPDERRLNEEMAFEELSHCLAQLRWQARLAERARTTRRRTVAHRAVGRHR